MKNIKQGTIKVILKPNSPKNKIIKFDSEKNAYRIEIKAPAKENKANLELIKFLSRLLKKNIKIIQGFKSIKVLKVRKN